MFPDSKVLPLLLSAIVRLSLFLASLCVTIFRAVSNTFSSIIFSSSIKPDVTFPEDKYPQYILFLSIRFTVLL